MSRAVLKGHEAMVRLLLDTGRMDVYSTELWGCTPLSGAASEGHEAVVRLLLETGRM